MLNISVKEVSNTLDMMFRPDETSIVSAEKQHAGRKCSVKTNYQDVQIDLPDLGTCTGQIRTKEYYPL